MKILLLLLTLALTSCRSTIPADTAILVGGKNPAQVHVGGMNWKEALKAIGITVLQAGANYAINKYGPPAGRGK